MIKISYSGYRFPPEIIQHAIGLYLRFTLSFRDVEDLLAERGIMVSYETVRRQDRSLSRRNLLLDLLLAGADSIIHSTRFRPSFFGFLLRPRG